MYMLFFEADNTVPKLSRARFPLSQKSKVPFAMLLPNHVANHGNTGFVLSFFYLAY
jgi:hypothetical protein